MSGCWLAQFSDTPCEGRLVKCHLIPRQLMRKNFRYGAIRVGEAWLPAQNPHLETRDGQRWALHKMLCDPQAVVLGCGGAMGSGGHHGELDHSRRLRIPRGAIPPEVEGFARVLGFEWWLDREYGAV